MLAASVRRVMSALGMDNSPQIRQDSRGFQFFEDQNPTRFLAHSRRKDG
jgi:hypothetical protein